MTNRVVVPEQDSVVVEIEIAAPPDRVFQALTDASNWSNGGAPLFAKRLPGRWIRDRVGSGGSKPVRHLSRSME